MKEVIKVLHLEGSKKDAETIRKLLSDSVMELKMDCTATENEFISFLRKTEYNIILSDFKLPAFDGFTALKRASEICPDVPFICVSESIGESLAVELLKRGAADYILKDRLDRLPSAIARAHQDANDKKIKRITEEKLASRNAILNALINSPKDMIIFSLDKNYCYTAFNEKHSEEMRKIWSAEIALGENLLNYMYDEKLRNLAKQSIDRTIQGDSFSEIQHQPGYNNYYEFTWEPVLQSKQITGVTVFIRDITQQINLQNSLREKEELYRTLCENSTVGIYRTSPDGKILMANPTLVNLLGYSSFDKLSKRNLEESGFEPSYERARFIEMIESKGMLKGLESSWTRFDGEKVFVSESARAIRDENGKTLYYDGIVEDITLRKKAEELRKESEIRYHSLFDNMLNGFAYCRMIYDGDIATDFIYLEVNKAFELLTGLKDVKGKKVTEVIPGIRESDYELFERYSRVALTGYPEVFENFVDSLGMWFSISVYSPQKEYFVAVFDVITGRKLAEEKIRNLAKFPSENPDPVLRVDSHGCLLYANEASYKLLTWNLEIGLKAPQVLKKVTEEVLRSGIKKIIEAEHNQRLFSFNFFPVKDSGYANIYGRDISDLKKAEKALLLKNFVFDASIAANSISDVNGIATEANDAFVKLWGYPNKKKVIGRPITSFLKNSEEAEIILKALQKTGEWEGDYTALRMDNSTFYAHGLATTINDVKGNCIGYQSSVLDVTERNNHEEEIRKLNDELEQRVILRTHQLEAVNKELEAFSYSVSHDLGAPLRAVHGYTKILLEEYENKLDDEGKRLFRIVYSSAYQMGELIDDLLNLSRIGRSNMTYSLIDMKKLIRSVLDELISPDEKEKIIFNIENLTKAYGDNNLIKQVWINLISNALKYSSKSENPEISIGSEITDKMVIYTVKDNGVGFDMNYKHKLFGVFQRLHSEIEFEGNGVGLAIVQRIVNRHGGKVWAEGDVGKGAAFYFSLPVGGDGQQVTGSKKTKYLRRQTPYS